MVNIELLSEKNFNAHSLDNYVRTQEVKRVYRRQGLGRKLFEMGKAEAEKAGAKALYISACPSEETIAFYMSMGAFVTKDIIKQIADDEPYDLQMACRI